MKKIRFLFFLALLLMTAVGAKADGLAVTSDDIGKVLCNDGNLYDNVSAAEAENKFPVAMIAYIDTQNHTGLAIALEDARVYPSYSCTWNEKDDFLQGWESMYEDYAVANVANATWKVPTAEEWQQMLIGNSQGSVSDDLSNVSLNCSAINILLSNNAYELSPLQSKYWTATSYDEDNGWYAEFDSNSNNMQFGHEEQEQPTSNYLRPCLAFDVESEASNEGIAVSSDDIGKVLCTDGSIYDDKLKAFKYGKTPVAMIAYVDTENNKGLAIALEYVTYDGTWNYAQTEIANWVSSEGYTLTGLGMTWKLPTKDDWQNMIIDCGGSVDVSGTMDYSDLCNQLETITDGNMLLQNTNWTANEKDDDNAWVIDFDFSNKSANFYPSTKTNGQYIHACIEFNVAKPVSIVATTDHVGKVLCTDGSIYDSVSDAAADGKIAAAKIAYVDTEHKKGLALALVDENGPMCWDDSKIAAETHTPVVGGATWRLPTIDEWQLIVNGIGVPVQNGNYWSSTIDEYDSDRRSVLGIENGSTDVSGYQYWNYSDVNTRACLDFDVSDAPEPELLSLNVTTAHVGKVVCTDGSIYDSVAEAEADDKTPAGMIAFVDMEYETGLAIALDDESGLMDWSAASAAAGAHTPAVLGATWKLPTIDEWRNMLVGCGATIEYENDNTTTYGEINYKLYIAGGSGTMLDESYIYENNRCGFGEYWSSTINEDEYNNQNAQYAEFKDDEANLSYSDGLDEYKYVRACFPFNVTLTKYPITVTPSIVNDVECNKTEAAEGQTVGLTISNIPEGKYVSGVYITKTDNGDWVDEASQSIYNENEYYFTMPDYPVTVNVYFENIQEVQEIGGLYYTLNNQYGTAEVASHPDNGYSGAITVPATVKPSYQTYYVTSIGQDAFAGYNNNEITSVTLGSNVRTIRRDAFYNTTLTSLTLNEGLTNIEQYAFRNGDYPIAIPSTVSDISTWAFKGYKGTSMSVAAGNGKYDSRGGCNAIIETAENTLVAGCSATTIPATVTMIGEAAFDGVGLTSITIPANVTTLHMGAFANNPLTAINIPATVTTIYNNPLYGCSELETITVADGNPNYDSRDNCNAICDKGKRWVIATCKNTVIPQTITGIGTFAFAYRQDLNEFKVPKHIGIINDNAFAYSNLWNITMADNNNLIIGRWAFGQCKQLRTVKMGRGISRIDEQVFMGCSNLSNIYVNAPLIPKVKNITFEVDDNGNFTTAKVHVPSASLKTYQKANFWKELNLVGSNSVQGVTATFESVNDTKCSAAGEGSELITEEGTIWDCSASSATITTHGGETCLQVSSSPVTLSDCYTNDFIITDSVKRIVVRAANVTDITCDIVDISEDPDASLNQTQSVTGLTATDDLQDFALNFDDSKKYSKAKVNVTITGTSPIYVQSISIVQGGGDYVITDESSTTVQGVEYSNTMSAPGSGDKPEAIIDNVPVYVYTTCLPTAPVRDTGLKFYTLSSSTNTSLQFAEVTGALQANTPYLVAVSQDAEIGMSVENESVTLKKESDNYSLSSDGAYKFVGTTTGLTNAEAVAASAYILQDGNVWGQVTAENFEAYIPPFRAYIVPTGPSSRSMLSGGFTDATGIKTLQLTDRDGTKHYFDLNGRRISSPAASGVYVTNGKKVIIKK